MSEPFLLNAIAANPHDLASWLVFADWLEEHGDARGELIRLLLELTRQIDAGNRMLKETRMQQLAETCTGPVTAVHFSTHGARHLLIPAGEFLMGSPNDEKDRDDDETQRPVTVPLPFYMGSHPVTQGEWTAVTGDAPWKGKNHVIDGASYPATHVSWDDALEFCVKLTTREREVGRITASQAYYVPSESEWEYACRAGRTTRFCYGDDAGYSQLEDYAWFDANAGEAGEEYAHPVGLKRPNAWGLFDMHGNVWEWCANRHGDELQTPGVDPKGSTASQLCRGGCWNDFGFNARSAYRDKFAAGMRNHLLGFRTALSTGPS